jgi:hypothetical protein
MQIAKKSIGETTITFTWADETETVVDVSEFSEEVRNHAMLHGFSQKLGDSYSGVQGDLMQAKAQFEDVLSALTDGDWNRKGGGASSGGIWVEAIAKASGNSLEDVLAKWNTMDDAEKAAAKKHPAVKLAKAEIELARATAKAAEAKPFDLA